MQAPWSLVRTAGHQLRTAWRHSPQRIRRAAILALIVLSSYVVARLLLTRDEANPLSFWMLFIAEAMSLLSLILFAYEAWRLPPLAKYEPLHTSVDIAIATHNEPLDILEPTIVASLRVWDVRHVWVLDDGRRDEVRQLCAEIGARYVTREDNRHAKAGNINAALPRIDSELILFLDADHVPQRNAIVDMSGYFRDPAVALVQSPHDFRNRDSAQHTHGTHHEQSLFFEVLMPARERHQAVFWCGSAALIRRSALVEVGGVATETVSEDLHTSLKLQLKGYTIRYHNDALVTGIAPHTTADYLLQRDRWARGTLAVLTGPQSPLFGRGWRPSQRLHYVNNLLYYFLPLQRLLYVGVLVLALLLAWLPIGNVTALFAIAVSIVFATSLFASLALARGRLEIGEGAANTYLSAEIYVRALVTTALRRKSGFAVTPKSISELTFGERMRVLALPTLVAVVIAVSWALRAAQQAFGQVVPGIALPGALSTTAFAILTFFAALELATVTPMLVREYRRRQKRQRWRFTCSIPAAIAGTQAVITDLHEEGLSFESETSGINFGDLVTVEFQADLPEGPVEIHGVARVVRKATLEGEKSRFGCTIEWDGNRDRRDLIDLCYVRLASDDRAYLESTSA